MYYFAKLVADCRESAIAKHRCDLVKTRNFGWGLHNVQGICVGGVTNTESINGDSVVTSGNSNIDVGVVVVVV
jgi:hypothetical protein